MIDADMKKYILKQVFDPEPNFAPATNYCLSQAPTPAYGSGGNVYDTLYDPSRADNVQISTHIRVISHLFRYKSMKLQMSKSTFLEMTDENSEDYFFKHNSLHEYKGYIIDYGLILPRIYTNMLSYEGVSGAGVISNVTDDHKLLCILIGGRDDFDPDELKYRSTKRMIDYDGVNICTPFNLEYFYQNICISILWSFAYIWEYCGVVRIGVISYLMFVLAIPCIEQSNGAKIRAVRDDGAYFRGLAFHGFIFLWATVLSAVIDALLFG